MKYMLSAFNYPYRGADTSKQTRFLIVALFWFVVLSLEYDGVDFSKRAK
jgi:hypothetical protein